MKVRFRNGDLQEAERALARISGLELEKSFMILIARNYRTVKRAYQDYVSDVRFPTEEQLDVSPEFYQFAVERTKLERTFRGDVLGYGTALDALYEKYPKVFEERCKHKLEADVLGQREIELDLLPIPFEKIPDRGKALDYSPLLDFITGLDAKEKTDG